MLYAWYIAEHVGLIILKDKSTDMFFENVGFCIKLFLTEETGVKILQQGGG